MQPALSVLEDDVFAALRGFLLSVLPSTVEVVRAQANRVPAPGSAEYVTMTPVLRSRMGTNETTFADGFPSVEQYRVDTVATKVGIQIDFHGAGSADYVQIVETLFRSDIAIDALAAGGLPIAPLYTSDPRQMPFSNDQHQVETRWMLEVTLQVDAAVTTAQDFADSLAVGVISVDATYPPA